MNGKFVAQRTSVSSSIKFLDEGKNKGIFVRFGVANKILEYYSKEESLTNEA